MRGFGVRSCGLLVILAKRQALRHRTAALAEENRGECGVKADASAEKHKLLLRIMLRKATVGRVQIGTSATQKRPPEKRRGRYKGKGCRPEERGATFKPPKRQRRSNAMGRAWGRGARMSNRCR